jgi:antitoxin HicB
MVYRVTLARQDDDAVLVSFPDFPGVHATGEYEEDALVQARSALTDAVARCMRERRPVPPASRRPAPPSVRVPAIVAAKVDLYEAMRAAGVTKAELARRLRWHLPQVDRLLDVHHASRIDRLEQGAAAIGKRVVITLEDLESRSIGGRHGHAARDRR